MPRVDKRVLLLDFFREKEKDGRSFTFQEAAEKTGYSPKSVNKYISEKLKGKFIFKSEKGGWVSKGCSQLSNDDFVRLMSQSTAAKVLTPDEKIYQKLIKRSLDAFTLALEVYNRPSLSNRVEAFAIMMVNSWELFLKAEVLDSLGHEKVFYSNGKSISISDALPLRLQNNDPVKKNIETLIQLRDHATHLLIPELQPQLSRLFQANVLNYQERYKNQMGNSPLSGQSVGMLSLVIDGPEPEIGVIKESYGELTAKEVLTFLKQFEETSKDVDSDKYTISIDYKLKLSKKTDEADLTLSTGVDGQQAVIITTAKDLNATHPYTTNSAIEQINRDQSELKVTSYSFQAVLFKHKIKANNNSEYHNYTDIHRYSAKFVNWFVNNLVKQNNWLKSAVDSYKKR